MASTLHLSVINDGNTYHERLKIARQCIGEFNAEKHINGIRQIVNDQANKERKEFGSKFTSSDIREACKLVAEHDHQSILEDIAAAVAAGGTIFARGRKWFDSVNGNTYHSVSMTVGGFNVYLPMAYGYGEQWQSSAKEWLIKNEIVPNPGQYENGMSKPFTHPIAWGEAPYGLKREL